MDEFATFGTTHLVMLAFFLIGIWPVIVWGRGVHGSRGSVLDYLGPWPAYVVVEIVLVATIWA